MTQNDIIDCYNKTAKNYAEKYLNELSQKHLDQVLLKSFAAENASRGKMIDLGCGPGQTTKFLSDCGVQNIIGTDISPEMINVAISVNPQLSFEIADMLCLKYPDRYFGSAIAFYSIVHFTYEQLPLAFNEIKRVLANNGEFLFCFHIGNELVHLDNFLDKPVNIEFHFFEVNKITTLIKEAGFEIIDTIERQPYPNVEYPSKRAYIWVKKLGDSN
ncbi:MAG TPA: methyltransferase domain-containing protein [Parafilimonas sp.]|nr:methyltransferase domain-containing protein [Parafilimonas sp.]